MGMSELNGVSRHPSPPCAVRSVPPVLYTGAFIGPPSRHPLFRQITPAANLGADQATIQQQGSQGWLVGLDLRDPKKQN